LKAIGVDDLISAFAITRSLRELFDMKKRMVDKKGETADL
jgi:hypothetical protein